MTFALIAASIATAYYAGPLLRDQGSLNTTGMLHSSPAPYLWLFLAGGAAALYWRRVSRWFEGKIWWWLLAYGVAAGTDWVVKGTISLPYRIPNELTVPRALILAGLVIALAHSYSGISKWMRGVDLSYGLYLFHLPLPFGLHYAGIGGSGWLAAGCMAVAFVLAALSWVLVERPALMIMSRINRSRFFTLPQRAASTH